MLWNSSLFECHFVCLYIGLISFRYKQFILLFKNTSIFHWIIFSIQLVKMQDHYLINKRVRKLRCDIRNRLKKNLITFSFLSKAYEKKNWVKQTKKKTACEHKFGAEMRTKSKCSSKNANEYLFTDRKNVKCCWCFYIHLLFSPLVYLCSDIFSLIFFSLFLWLSLIELFATECL